MHNLGLDLHPLERILVDPELALHSCEYLCFHVWGLITAASTLHRWLNAGFVAGEQLTPGAPWRIRITEDLRKLLVDTAPPDYVPVAEAMRRLGVSRQTVWQRVKIGELEAVRVREGKRKGLRIRVVDPPAGLFD
jgi:hypothetical protein